MSGAGLPAHAAEPPIRLKKAVKFGMIRIDGSVEDKFNLIKELGFQGVEMDSPGGPDIAEAVAASKKTGILRRRPVSIATVCSATWSASTPEALVTVIGDSMTQGSKKWSSPAADD